MATSGRWAKIAVRAARSYRGVRVRVERAHRSIQEWVEASGGDLTGEGRREIGVAYNDGPFEEHVHFAGSRTDREHYRWLTVAPGHHHAGQAGAGVVLIPRSAGHGVWVEDDHTRIEGLEITRWAIDSGRLEVDGVRIEGCRDVLLRNLLVHDDGHLGSDSDVNGINLELAQTGATIQNSMVYGIARAGIALSSAPAAFVRLENTTVFDCLQEDNAPEDYGNISVTNSDGARLEAFNVISLEPSCASADVCGSAFQIARSRDVSFGASDHNVSSDSSAPGAATWHDVAAVGTFVSVERGGVDLHLTAGAVGIDEGLDLSGRFQDDIDGLGRPVGRAWDIGADEFGAP